MYISIIFILVQLLNCNQCGTRIVGGNEALPHQFPWQALLTYRNIRVLCGGTVISTKHILTAAHCNEGPYSLYKAVLGRHSRTTGGKEFSVKQTIVHPRRDKSTWDYDLRIVVVTPSIQFTS